MALNSINSNITYCRSGPGTMATRDTVRAAPKAVLQPVSICSLLRRDCGNSWKINPKSKEEAAERRRRINHSRRPSTGQ